MNFKTDFWGWLFVAVATVVVAVATMALLFLGGLLLTAEPAEASCLQCFEPVPEVKEHESDRGASDRLVLPDTTVDIAPYPGELERPPLPPTPDPYPGSAWARDYCPIEDDSVMGYHWGRCDGSDS